MSVYRIYQGGAQTYQGWNASSTTPYNNTAIDTIKDPNGAVSNKEITSIPSPFARIDLIKTAFEEINRACNGLQDNALRAELNKSTIYHKMVSDSLDIGEIFFNFDKYKDKLQIIAWNPGNLLKQFKTAVTSGQQCYADALKTYWIADANVYNFNKVKNIYILNYKNGPNPINIIGATSPATLFFSNANNLSYVNDIQFGQDKPFDGIYQPLYKRDPKYIEYLWWLCCTNPNFATDFPEVDEYLRLTYRAVPQNIKNRLQQIQTQSPLPDDLGLINTNSNGVANTVEILGIPFYQKELKPVSDSDFTIKSTKKEKCNYLVLPIDSGNRYANWKYTTSNWGTQNAAKPYDNTPIVKRILPNDNTPQPYLTIGDFLEDTILSSPHKLNSNLFFDGGFESDDISYLLPLKPLFFEFFSVGDLIDNNMLKMEKRAGQTLLVTLQIPCKKGNIEYSRLYSLADADRKRNEGHIVGEEVFNDCEVSITPAVATPSNLQPYYTLSTISPFGQKMDLEFYQDGKKIKLSSSLQERNTNIRELYKGKVYTVENKFEFIQIITPSGTNIAIPTLPIVNGNDSVSFAVDLGTSNTHIEYMVNNNSRNCHPFEYTSNDNMLGLLFIPRIKSIAGVDYEEGLEQVRSILERDLIPTSLGNTEVYHFPTRTALSYANSINWNVVTNPLELTNVCLPYGKQMPLDYNGYETNIKWGDDGDSQNRLAYYIKNILLLLRNKVLTIGGDISKTSLIWFYPTSMTPYRQGLFQNLWNEEFKKMFGDSATLDCISESLAPVCFHTQNNNTAKDMLTIDIGGGTTDLAFASRGKVDYVTSFRFAANTLFEDSFSKSNSQNGIIDFFKPQYFELAQDVEELRSILCAFDKSTTDMANTLFAISDIPCVRKKNFGNNIIDFITKLRNDHNFKLEVIIFYASILYHAGKIIKAEGLSLPRHIALSGNGSNILKVLASPDTHGKKQLADFSKLIIEIASGITYDDGSKLEILGFGTTESPKQSTCKGGLLKTGNTNVPETIVLKSASNSILNGETYSIATEDYIAKVQNEVLEFFKALKVVDSKFNFADNFGISDDSWPILNDILRSKEDINTFIHRGIESRMEKEDNPISETFFFYPIACILQQYSLNMFNLLNNQK
jgi:hypothetical protein